MSAAARQAGVITLGQACELGASGKVMAALARSGTLERVHPGVFVLAGRGQGHPTAVRAALAAAGPEAAAACRSAAWLTGLVARPPARPEIVVPLNTSHRLAGVDVHRSRGPVPVTTVQGVRCTTVPRTLVDLAAGAAGAELALAVDRALADGRTRIGNLLAEMDAGCRPGVASLRRCLEERAEVGRPDASVLESQFTRLLHRSGLPSPVAEFVAGPGGRYRLDFAYPERLLAIEVNGYAWHHSHVQMGNDQARQRRLVLDGWLVLVFSWRDVAHDGERVVAEVAEAYRLRQPR